MAASARISIPPARATTALEDALFEVLAGIPCSFVRNARGGLDLFVEKAELSEARSALASAGLRRLEIADVPDRDWVAESAALRRAVAVGPFVLDPHDGARASAPAFRQRIYLPAARAFGTGSHESTRLALRLLLHEKLAGLRVLDVGCGTGVLAFVAALSGAAFSVAFDIDRDAAIATRQHMLANGVRRLGVLAGPLEAVSDRAPFDLVVANMLLSETRPLLHGLHARLAPGGHLLTSGLLLSQENEWLALLRSAGFCPTYLTSEGEWLGVTAERGREQ